MLTSNENAAKTVGVEPLSLESLARQVMGEDHVANHLAIQRLLRAAVADVLGSRDSAGTASTLLPPVRELFRVLPFQNASSSVLAFISRA